MKPVLRLSGGIAAVALLAVILSACEGDRGPAGPPGTTECMNCHSDDFGMANFLLPFQAEFAASLHANGETFVRRSSSCSRCHTNEGFQNYLLTGEGGELVQSSPIGCFTCHSPHANGDFALRKSGPTDLLVGAVYDKGASNLCAECHQSREASPPIADGTTLTSRNSRWGPHHGPQSNILSGQGAYEFSGAYSTGPSHASIADGCIACHMGPPPESALAGGHSFNIFYEYHGAEEINGQACIGCHDAWTDDDELATTDTEAFQDAFQTDLDALQAAMGPNGLGWLTSEDPAEATGGIVAAGTYDADELGAIFNFRLLAEDRSQGVHNTVYAREVLDATLAYVNSLP